MPSRSPNGKKREARRTARRSRWWVRGAVLFAGTLAAAAGAWLSRPPGATPAAASGATPAGARATPSGPARLLVGPPGADPSVEGGRLQVPVVDWTEVLPSCHN
jgi:hypothetical protein